MEAPIFCSIDAIYPSFPFKFAFLINGESREIVVIAVLTLFSKFHN